MRFLQLAENDYVTKIKTSLKFLLRVIEQNNRLSEYMVFYPIFDYPTVMICEHKMSIYISKLQLLAAKTISSLEA